MTNALGKTKEWFVGTHYPAAKRCRRGRFGRIAHLVRQYDPSVGGLETYVRELSGRQSNESIVYVVTLNKVFGSKQPLRKVERQGRVVIVRIPFFGSREFFLPLLTPGLLKRFSIVHVHATDQLLDAVFLLSARRLYRYVVATHGLFFHTERHKRIKQAYLRLVTRWSLRGSDRVFAVSANDQRIVKTVGINAVLLRNPIVPLGSYMAGGNDLIYIGRIAENKRIDKLVEFALAVIARDSSAKLHIVGADPDRLWPNIASACGLKESDDRIIYHGYLTPDLLRPVLERCGFVASASRYEGYGLSMIEGMSVGLLPVMHDNAAFRETHNLSGSGLIVDFDHPDSAAERFLQWRDTVGDEEKRAAMTYAHAQSWDAVVETVHQAYEDILHVAR